MMDVTQPKDTTITKSLRKNGAVFLYSDVGVLRIIPQAGGIIRVSFSCDGEFKEEQGRNYSDFSGSIDFEVHENNSEIAIETSEGDLRFRQGKMVPGDGVSGSFGAAYI